MYQSLIKPFLDKVVALIVLLIFSPVLLCVILILAIVNKGNVWFIQPRPGFKEKIFKVIKFKTMTDGRDERGKLLPDKERLKGIGKFIRKTSLDELPQLINVLRGEMSIVGPRPLLVKYLSLYNEQQRRRHLVKPGITGWAQVNGRNAVTWQQRFEMDSWYVSNISFWLDLKILFITIFKVLKSEGVSSATSPTMENFTGNREA